MAMLGESIDPRLLRLDPQVFRSIESAGAAQAAMYGDLGETAEMTIAKIDQSRKTEEMYESLVNIAPQLANLAGHGDESIILGRLGAAQYNPEKLADFSTAASLLSQEQGGNLKALELNALYKERYLDKSWHLQERTRLGNQEWLTGERVGKQEFDEKIQKATQLHVNLGREDEQNFLLYLTDDKQEFIRDERIATQDFAKYIAGYRSDLKKSEEKELENLLHGHRIEFDDAKNNNLIKKAGAIQLQAAMIEEELEGRRDVKVKRLAQELRAVGNIEDINERQIAQFIIEQKFADEGLPIPDINKIPISRDDLRRKVFNGEWTEENVPVVLRDKVSARDYGQYILATQGSLFLNKDGSSDLEANKEYQVKFLEAYDLKEHWMKRAAGGVGLFAMKAASILPFVKDPFEWRSNEIWAGITGQEAPGTPQPSDFSVLVDPDTYLEPTPEPDLEYFKTAESLEAPGALIGPPARSKWKNPYRSPDPYDPRTGSQGR